jgi:hypothetical protein
MRKTAILIMVALCASLLPAQDAGLAALTSVWETSFGTVTIIQEGPFISGTYPYASGKLIGAVSGGVFVGYWWENDDATGCGPEKAWCGPLTLRFAEDGKSFKGFYDKASRGTLSPSQVGPWYTWDGKLVSGNFKAR